MIKKGRGISAIMHPTGFKGGGDPDQALLKLKPDGTVDLLTGVTDYGQQNCSEAVCRRRAGYRYRYDLPAQQGHR